ncbi:MAG: metallophosphoesterase, partial [Flavobacteriales bacterium]
MGRIITAVALFVFIDLIAFRGVFQLSESLDPFWRRFIRWGFWVVNVACYVGVFTLMSRWSKRFDSSSTTDYTLFNWAVGFFIVWGSTKLIFVIFHVLQSVFDGARWLVDYFRQQPDAESHEGMSRSQFFNQLGLGISAAWLGSLMYGVTRGKYDYRVIEHEIALPNLPKSFDGVKIVQISDMHLGSFNGAFEDVQPGLDLIQKLQPDYIFFTGDLVNNFSDEAEPWIPMLQALNAKEGKFSILGNHDYGDYAMRDQPARKAKHFERLVEIHGEMGFKLLRNEHVILNRGDERVYLVGCENWGLDFHQYGDLDAAMSGIPDDACAVLLSHDPTHWSEQVLKSKNQIALTFSGHTHGAQMGVELPQFGIKWSPVSVRYRRWGGLYQEGEQFLHINRGFGFLAFPGRVGMSPEITSIILRSKA